MPDDAAIARHALDLQARGRWFRMMDLPGYMNWSERKLAGGESAALVAHLDATSMWLLPEDAAKMSDRDYDEMLEDLNAGFEESSG